MWKRTCPVATTDRQPAFIVNTPLTEHLTFLFLASNSLAPGINTFIRNTEMHNLKPAWTQAGLTREENHTVTSGESLYIHMVLSGSLVRALCPLHKCGESQQLQLGFEAVLLL